jgi:hypothetical protein
MLLKELLQLHPLTKIRYGLGPNGGIVTSLNLFATRFDQVRISILTIISTSFTWGVQRQQQASQEGNMV